MTNSETIMTKEIPIPNVECRRNVRWRIWDSAFVIGHSFDIVVEEFGI